MEIPGLDCAAPYTSRLSARSALYTEFHLLLDGQRAALPLGEYRRRVVDDNCLSRSSTSARQKLWMELKNRYRLDASDPLFDAFWTEWQRCLSEPERQLTAYILFALNDRLAADVAIEWLFPLLLRAPAEIRVTDVLTFISHQAKKHPEVTEWSEQTSVAVAQKYCASIRDFGLAIGVARKKTVRPALYGPPVRLLIRALGFVRTPPLELIRHPVFRLLAINNTEVIDALSELNRVGALRFRMQGDIVELDVAEAA